MKSPVAIEMTEAQVAESSLNEPEEGEIETHVVESSGEGSEEGEIVDDLEVVSDDSITFSPQKSGKSIPDMPPLSSLTDIKMVVKQGTRGRINSRRKRQLTKEFEKGEYSTSSASRVPVLELEDISPSISDVSLSPDPQLARKRRHSHCHHKHIRKRRKIHSHKQSLDSDSETDDDEKNRTKKQTKSTIATGFQESHVNKKLQQQLRAAVSVNSLESYSKNTLKDKLFAMSKKTDNESADAPSEIKVTPDTVAMDVDKNLAAKEIPTNNDKSNGTSGEEVSKQKHDKDSTEKDISDLNTYEDSLSSQSSEPSDKNDDKDYDNELDSELIELRLEALKTALLNKYKDKKQNQIKENETNKENNNTNATEHTLLEINKENNVDVMPHDKPIENEHQENNENNPQSPEEDEDVLRALLLASMSNKITRKVPEASQAIDPTKNVINSKNIRLINEVIIKPIKEPPLVKPFKIKEIKKPPSLAKMKFPQNKIDKRIHLPKVKPLIINVNSDSDTEDDLFSTQHFERCMTDSNITKTTEKISQVANAIDPNVQNTPVLKSRDKATEKTPKADSAPAEIDNIAQPRDNILKSSVFDNVKFSSVVKLNTGSNIVPISENLSSNTISKTGINMENKSVPSLEVLVPLKNKIHSSTSEKLSPRTNLCTDVAIENKSSPPVAISSVIESSAEKLLKEKQTPLVVTPSIERSVNTFLQKQRALAPAVIPPFTESSIDTFSMIESSVDRFLREQRAKVEAEKKSEKYTNIITAQLPVTEVTSPKNVENIIVTRNLVSGAKKINLTPINRTNNRVPNSAVKLLPKNKQIEYQKLLIKLRNAEKNKVQNKRPRGRRSSQRLSMSENNNQPSVSSKTIMPSSQKQRFTNPKTPEAKKDDAEKETSPESGESRALEERKSDALMLHNTLKQMQEKINGRLQIQEKYNSLKPLMQKINEVSKEQKHWNQQVKKLLDELAEAKNNQEKVHQEMTDSVKQLVEGKKKIDGEGTHPNQVDTSKLFTPTGSLTHPTLSTLTATLNSPVLKLSKKDANNAISMSSPTATSDSDINIGDPNDIEIVISKTNKKKVFRKALLFNESVIPKKLESSKMVVNFKTKASNVVLTKSQRKRANRNRRKALLNSISSLENQNIKTKLSSTHTQNTTRLAGISLRQPVFIQKKASNTSKTQDKMVSKKLSNSLPVFSSTQNKQGNKDQAKRSLHEPLPSYQSTQKKNDSSSSQTDEKEKELAKKYLLGNVKENSRLSTKPKDHGNQLKNSPYKALSSSLTGQKEKERSKNVSLLKNLEKSNKLTESLIQNKKLSNVVTIANKLPKPINDNNASLSKTPQEDPNLNDDIINRIDNMINDSYSLINKVDLSKEAAGKPKTKSSSTNDVSPMIKNLDAAISHLSHNLLSLYTENTVQQKKSDTCVKNLEISKQERPNSSYRSLAENTNSHTSDVLTNKSNKMSNVESIRVLSGNETVNPISKTKTNPVLSLEEQTKEIMCGSQRRKQKQPIKNKNSSQSTITQSVAQINVKEVTKSNHIQNTLSQTNPNLPVQSSNLVKRPNLIEVHISPTLEQQARRSIRKKEYFKSIRDPKGDENKDDNDDSDIEIIEQTVEIIVLTSDTEEENSLDDNTQEPKLTAVVQQNLANNGVNFEIQATFVADVAQNAAHSGANVEIEPIFEIEPTLAVNVPRNVAHIAHNGANIEIEPTLAADVPQNVHKSANVEIEPTLAADFSQNVANISANVETELTLAVNVSQNLIHNCANIEIDNEDANKNNTQNTNLSELTAGRNEMKYVAQNIGQRTSMERSEKDKDLSTNDAQVTKKFKYVSPLDNANRSLEIDPFSIMCPFEVMGRCKDTECAYKHFLPK